MRVLAIMFFLSLSFCSSSFSQIITAGQSSGNDIVYGDFIPDIDLDCPFGYGDLYEAATLDINQDGVNDFYISTEMASGVSHSIKTSTIVPLGDNQISFARSETQTGYYGDTVTIFVAKAYSNGDTIIGDSTFRDGRCALNYCYSVLGHASFSISDWVGSGEKYVGFSLIGSSDTTYGWIRAYTPTESHLVMYDYAFINKDLSINSSAQAPFTIYPNPAENEINLKLDYLDGNKVVKIFDISGRLVYFEQIADEIISINTEGFRSGIYVVSVSNEKSSCISKFVKQ